MRVGLNLTGVINYGTCLPFRNVYRQSSWTSMRAGNDPNYYQYIFPHVYPAVDGSGRDVPTPTFDADGYLTNGNGRGQYDDQVVFSALPAVPAGTYKLRADGDGDWRLHGRVNGVSTYWSGTFTGRLVTTFDLTAGGLTETQLQIRRTNPADHVHNVQFMMPGCDFDDPLFFNDEFIRTLAGFPCLRLMDFMETNGDAVVEWVDRCPVTAQTFGDDNGLGGIPYESFAELARRTGADLWVNIPRRASNDWIARFGAMMLATLPSNTTLYVEHGNELWNSFTFQSALDTFRDGRASGLYPAAMSDFEVQNRWAARRSRQTTTLMQRAFGAGRVRVVFATMGAQTIDWGLDEWIHYGVDPGVTTRPAAPLATPNSPPYAAATSSYIGASLAEPPRIAATKAGGVDGIIAALNSDVMVGAASNAAACKSLTDAYGTKLMVYEGGFENFGQAALSDNDMATLSIAASRDPRMGPAAAHLLGVAANYVDLFMWFSHCSTPSNYGQYGLLETSYPAPATSPKFEAVHGAAVAGNVAPIAPPPPPIAVSSLSLSAPIASDRSTLAGTVTLTAPAPSPNGLPVSLSVDSIAVTVPSAVVVPAGATTAAFALVVGDLSASATATVRAAFSYSSTTATLALSPYIAPYALIPGNTLAVGLAALYLSVERVGPVLHDFSGNARHVAIPPGHWLTSPNLGAISLDGTYSLDVPLPLLPKYPMTLAVAATMPADSNTVLASLRDDAGHDFTAIRNDFGTDADATLDDAAMGFQVSSRLAVAADAWHTYVLVIEATRLTFYLDGVVVGAATALPSAPTGRVAGLSLGGVGAGNRARATLSVALLAGRAWGPADASAFALSPASMARRATPPPPATAPRRPSRYLPRPASRPGRRPL